MKQTFVLCLISVLGAVMPVASVAENAEPTPTMRAERVREFQDLRFGMFICWSFSTFSGYEWTPGVDDVDYFHPSGFDPDSCAAAAKEAGMSYILFRSTRCPKTTVAPPPPTRSSGTIRKPSATATCFPSTSAPTAPASCVPSTSKPCAR